jgi:hypothetical protein
MAFVFRIPPFFTNRALRIGASILSTFPIVFSYTPTGGATAGGSADLVFTRVINPTGGAVAGGTSANVFTRIIIPTGGAIAGGAARIPPVYLLSFEVGGPGFMMGDILLAQRVDYDATSTKLLVYRVVAEVIRLDAEGESTVRISEGEDYLDDFGDGIEFVRIGNRTDATRRGSIYMTSDDENGPYLDVIDGITQYSDLGTLATIKVRLGNLAGITDTDFSPDPLVGFGLYAPNVYLKGNMILGVKSSISWAQVTDKPSIPTIPGYITSTKITSVEIDAPILKGNAAEIWNTLKFMSPGTNFVEFTEGGSAVGYIVNYATSHNQWFVGTGSTRIWAMGGNLEVKCSTGAGGIVLDSDWVTVPNGNLKLSTTLQFTAPGTKAVSFVDGSEVGYLLSYASTHNVWLVSSANIRLYAVGGDVELSPSGSINANANINFATGGVLKVSGTQVVGAQGAAVANATDATTVIARLNDLLSRLRTHGLIAT